MSTGGSIVSTIDATLYQWALSVVDDSTKSEQHELAREVVDRFVDDDLDETKCFLEGGLIYDDSDLTCSDFLDADRFSWYMYTQSDTMPAPIIVEVNAKTSDTARVDVQTPTIQTQSPASPGRMTFVECILSFEIEISPHNYEVDSMISIMEDEGPSRD